MNFTNNSLETGTATSTAERILFFIKSKGPTSTAVLSQALEMTAEAARQQVQKLLAQGLIEGRQEAATGVGRPRQSWALTEAGNRKFPDTHSQLTVQLIGSIRQLFGEEGLDRLITQREIETRDMYLNACAGLPLAQRLERLAEIRSAEGYMAHITEDEAGWLLVEEHCPICAAAKTCQGFCRSELQIFQEVLADCATITREEHLLSGGLRCVYRVMAL